VVFTPYYDAREKDGLVRGKPDLELNLKSGLCARATKPFSPRHRTFAPLRECLPGP